MKYYVIKYAKEPVEILTEKELEDLEYSKEGFDSSVYLTVYQVIESKKPITPSVIRTLKRLWQNSKK